MVEKICKEFYLLDNNLTNETIRQIGHLSVKGEVWQ